MQHPVQHIPESTIQRTGRFDCNTQFNTYQNPQFDVRIGLIATPSSTHARIHSSAYESDSLQHPVQHIPESTVQRTNRIVCNTSSTYQNPQFNVRIGLFATPSSARARIHNSTYESDCLQHPVQHMPESTIQRTNRIVCSTQFNIPESTIQRTNRIVCNTQFNTCQNPQFSVRIGLFATPSLRHNSVNNSAYEWDCL